MEAGKKDLWKAATFKGARKAQNAEFAQRSLVERLRWCCEMSEMIRLRDISEGKAPPAFRDRYN